MDYRDELSGDLVISWYFSRMFTRIAAASDQWAILDRQTAFRLKSRYSMLLFQHISSLVNLDHVTRKTFTVAELRAVLGVEPGKLERFFNLNKWAIKPAIEEISTESRFVLTATPRKTGRTVTSITIEWAEKPSEDRKALKAEMDRHSVGWKARRNGAVETVARSFPASGGIEFDQHWHDLKRAAGCNMDNTMIADKFRAWCAGKDLALDAQNIEQVFSSFCGKVGRV